MGIFNRIKSSFAKSSESPTDTALPATITAWDIYGRKIQIPRAEWEAKVLPGQLQKANDDPDALYQVIMMAVQDGFSKPLLAPSKRLLEIDKNRERSLIVRCIVLAKSGDERGAEKILATFIKQHGPTGSVLTNLAKLYSAKGQEIEAEATLWNAIQLDPNQENGLMWWAARAKERDGDQAFYDAMKKASTLPGSWRPQMWLARQCLSLKQRDEALGLYEHVLRTAPDGSVLTMISGDLGTHGYLQEIIDLVLPRYNPEQHDPPTGLNLLQACLDTKNVAQGQKLLHRMLSLNLPHLTERLLQYGAEFDKLQLSSASPRQPVGDPVEIQTTVFDRPIWTYGSEGLDWLLQPERERHETVVLIPLANKTPNNLKVPTTQTENDLGRLTRSLPLYLLESFHIWTTLKPKCVLPVVKGGGPVVTGVEWPAEQVLAFADGAEFAVSGTVEKMGDELQIDISLWDCSRKRIANKFTYKTPISDLGQTVLKLEQDVVAGLSASNLESPQIGFYRRPEPSIMVPYLDCLGQSLMLSLVQNDFVPLDAIWGERNIIGKFLSLVLQSPNWQIPKIMFGMALVKSYSYGSTVFEEFRRHYSQLIQDEKDATSPFYGLSPLLLRFCDPELFHLRKAELLRDANGQYRDWLESLTV